MTPSLTKPLKFVLIAGEASGDMLGAPLMRGLKNLCQAAGAPPPVFYGVGGEEMIKEGLQSFFPLEDLNIMSVFDNLTRLPKILRHLKTAAGLIRGLAPDAVITIDFPGFNLRLAKKLKDSGIPLIHYVAPTVWAWRPKRAQKFAKIYDHLLALYPFEPPYFEPVQLSTTFVGHPIGEYPVETRPREEFLKTFHLPEDRPLVVLLPGSRDSEVEKLLPVFMTALTHLNACLPISVVIPTVHTVKETVIKETKGFPLPFCIVDALPDKRWAYHAGTVALAASGTISLELAHAGLPMVIAYKVSALSAFLIKRLVKIPYACMINILHKKPIVPELLQDECVPEKLVQALLNLLNDPHQLQKQKEMLAPTVEFLSPADAQSPSLKAAQTVLNVIAQKKLPSSARTDR